MNKYLNLVFLLSTKNNFFTLFASGMTIPPQIQSFPSTELVA